MQPGLTWCRMGARSWLRAMGLWRRHGLVRLVLALVYGSHPGLLMLLLMCLDGAAPWPTGVHQRPSVGKEKQIHNAQPLHLQGTHPVFQTG